MKKQTSIRSVTARLLRRMPMTWQTCLLQRHYYRRHRLAPVKYPINPAFVKSVMIIPPEDLLLSLHQVSNIISLAAYFEYARIVFLAEKHTANIFQNIIPSSRVIEYNREDLYFLSPELSSFHRILGDYQFDVCIVLEKGPGIFLLDLAGRTGARYRIGYSECGTFPFLNLRVTSSESPRYLSDRNCSLAKAIGAPVRKPVPWTVPREISEQIGHLLLELGIGNQTALVGIDALSFYVTFGSEWTARCIAQLQNLGGFSFFCFTQNSIDEQFPAWLRSHGLPPVPPLTLPRTAALIYHSALIITGNTVLFRLANLLGKKAIGIFDVREIDTFFKPASGYVGIPYNRVPDEHTIAAIAESVAAAVLHKFRRA